VSKKTGKAGYALACANKFVKGVCELPRIKCGECPNQAFLPADDSAVLNHLQGRHVMGVYPLLRDEMCWFVAADFDGSAWMDDVRAFVDTCRQASFPVAVECSRSGNGAHAWFFFSEPIPAVLARQMATTLITATMAARHELAMKSYDRLFPNQDTMPKGGFGNLIALPLQQEPRGLGRSVFLDTDTPALSPHADQWAFLTRVPRLTRARIDALVSDASRNGRVIGLRIPTDAAADEFVRATLTPRPVHVPEIQDPLPAVIRGLLAARIQVEKAGLPSIVLNAIKRLAAFQNPEFYKKQNLRLSTALTPRVVACAEDLPNHVALPRGCQRALEELLLALGSRLELTDDRVDTAGASFQFIGQLTATQSRAADALLAHDIGVFVAPPGTGKTVVGTYLVAARKQPTLVLVHRQPLLEQWRTQLALFLGLPPSDIGQIGAGRRRPTGMIDVAMMQSLVRGDQIDEIGRYGQVIVDECHHVPAVSFERVLNVVKAKFVVGLTATPQRRDGHQPIIEMQLGPVRFTISDRANAAETTFRRSVIVRTTEYQPSADASELTIQKKYAALAADEARNELILDDVISALEEGRSPLLLTERRDHLEFFETKLRGVSRNLVVLRGGMTARARRQAHEQLESIPPDQERVVLATGRFIGEGFDDRRLDTLFLALPVSWKGTLAQYAGRLHRQHAGKTEVRVFDYVDGSVPMLRRMFERRLRGYRAIGYVVNAIGDGESPRPTGTDG
jgi:superfamily II DNA or RNA helicase